ncbi:MAG TPA: cell division protein FtsZ, partial [Methylocella sp.]|nr:cell division protein FtsZ [Methylocella sp.]
VAPAPRHYMDPPQHAMPQNDHYDAGPFVPPAPDSPVIRPQRMPQIDDLPLPAQNQIRAQRGELAAHHPETKRRSLLEKLASFGISRHESEARSAPAQEPRRLPARPPAPPPAPRMPEAAPIHAEYGGKRAQHPPAPQRAPQPSPGSAGRSIHQARSFDEDQLEIPAFLRRQSG